MKLLTISPSPHIQSNESTQRIMLDVLIALVPAFIISILFFGLGALKVVLTAAIACVLFEALIQKFLLKTKIQVMDGSALLTGVLLAFNLPAGYPIWMTLVGSLVAVGIAKLSFGGLGQNPFNPALVGRVFLLISFPVATTLWPKPALLQLTTDGTTGATILGLLKEGVSAGVPVSQILGTTGLTDLFMGQMGGSLGEISTLALLLGGVYLLYRRVITWHIPLSFLLSVFVLSGIFWMVNPEMYAPPFFHLVTGGVMLGALFMATDMVTSPMSNSGQILFGIGCGILTILIRVFGVYPEGVSFAILIMNAVVPLIDKFLKPKRYGR